MPNKLTWYTIIAAFWVAFLLILGVNFVGNTFMYGSPLEKEHEKLEKFGFPVEVVEEAPAEAGKAVIVAGWLGASLRPERARPARAWSP